MRQRSLPKMQLSKETLRELDPKELKAAAGAQHTFNSGCITSCVIFVCICP